MEKIQIQFRESDYKIYHEYCLRYYQAHDMVRKQSVHAFLDLYQKGVIPVEPQDIQQAREFLSGKCDTIRQDQARAGGDGEGTMLLQMRICSELLVFCDDLDKMYRLIQKQGIVANYVMILGTFANVIEENKNSQLAGKYNLDAQVVDSLAFPLSDSIRIRLGTDRNWRSALKELTVIAARFNKRYPEPRFDQDLLMLVAPTIVSRFEKDVETKEVLALIPTLVEESDLDEFESFLNKTPEVLQEEENAGIDWDAIYPPLKIVADAMSAQRDQWAREKSELCNHYALITPAGMSANTGMSQAPGQKSFNIAISQNGNSQIDTPMKMYDEPVPTSASAGIKPYVPIIIGVGIILLFIVGSIFLSGGFAPANNSTTKNVTAPGANVTKVTTKVTPKVNATPTAKPTATPAKVTATPTPAAYSSAEIGNHLVESTFGPDNTRLEKSTKDLVSISCRGSVEERDLTLLNTFISQFNSYSSTTKLSTSVDTDSEGDINLYFLPEDALSQINPSFITYTPEDTATGRIYFVRTVERSSSGTGDVQKVYVNGNLAGNVRDRWVLRAVLYQLGFMGEDAKYPDSLFYTDPTKGNKLTTIDLKAIQLMYGKKVTNGMTKAQLKAVI